MEEEDEEEEFEEEDEVSGGGYRLGVWEWVLLLGLEESGLGLLVCFVVSVFFSFMVGLFLFVV